MSDDEIIWCAGKPYVIPECTDPELYNSKEHPLYKEDKDIAEKPKAQLSDETDKHDNTPEEF